MVPGGFLATSSRTCELRQFSGIQSCVEFTHVAATLDTVLASKPMAPPFLLEGDGSRLAAEHRYCHGWVQHPWYVSVTPVENNGHSAGHLLMIFLFPLISTILKKDYFQVVGILLSERWVP